MALCTRSWDTRSVAVALPRAHTQQLCSSAGWRRARKASHRVILMAKLVVQYASCRSNEAHRDPSYHGGIRTAISSHLAPQSSNDHHTAVVDARFQSMVRQHTHYGQSCALPRSSHA